MAETTEPLSPKKVYYDDCPGCRIDKKKDENLGIPYREFFFIWVVTVCAALPVSSLFPFLYFMIRDLHVAKRVEDIGFYAGFVGSSLIFGRACSALFWGIVADKYGRKPVLVIGVVSVVIFSTIFGLTATYWMAIVTRLLLGLFNGILITVKAYASEICRPEHQAIALSNVSTAWGVGLIVGPAIGGFFAQPADKYPNIFSKDSFFGRFPYFLPCFLISLVALVAAISCLWLPETLHNCSHRDGTIEAPGTSSTKENVQEVQEKFEIKEESLLKNRPLMSSIFLYCVATLQDMAYTEMTIFTATFVLQNNAVPQHRRGAANGLGMTLQSLFGSVAPACAGFIFSWAQKRQHASFLPGDHVVFFFLNVIGVITLAMSFKPFLALPSR